MFNTNFNVILKLREDLINILSDFENLGEDWTGESSSPPCKIITKNVLYLIDNLPLEYVLKLDIQDDLTPTPLGSICIDFWLNKNSQLSLQVGKNICNFYLQIEGRYICGYNNLKINEVYTLDLIKEKLEVLYK